MNKKEYFLYLFFILFLIGCNIHDPSNFHGQLTIYMDQKIANEAMSSEEFNKIRDVFNEAVADFGLIEEAGLSKNDILISNKSKQPIAEYLSLEGSDADIGMAVSNFRNSFKIDMNDWSYNYETEFFKKLKEKIVSALKNELGFSDYSFKEVGVFIFNY